MALTKISGNVVQQNNFNLTGIVTATSFTGDLTGDVTGNVTGDVTGDLTGNVTGNVSSSGANTLGSLTVTNDATVGGALTVTGNLTVNGTTTTIDTVVTAIDTLAVDGDVTAGGNLNITGVSTFGGNVDLGDNDILRLGDSQDLQIYHNGTHSYIKEEGTGELRLGSNNAVRITKHDSETIALFTADGSIDLYYNNSKRFETTGYGVAVSGGLNVSGVSTFQNNVHLLDNDRLQIGGSAGTVDGLEIYHNGSNSYISDSGTGLLYITTNGTEVRINGSSGGEYSGRFINNGAVELYYDNSKKFETTGAGVTITGDARVTGILTVGQNSTTINGAHEYPTIRPTLDLNFAATKTLDRRITFTRDSLGTYVDELGIVRYAPNNVPRFDHDPTTGESLGLLIEESRTNSFTYSNDISQSVYSKNNVTYTANAAVAPDGTTTATKIIPTTSSAVHSISRIGTLGLDSMRSVYVKAAGYTSCTVYDINTEARATINLTTGEITNASYFNFDVYNEARGKITNAGNGWWRIEVGYDSYSAVNNPFHIYPNNNTTFAGDGTSGILVWGYQQEADAYPFATSYIPTSGSTVTRAADFAKITGTNFTNFYNSTEGTLFAESSIADLTTDNQGTVQLWYSSTDHIGMGYRWGASGSGTYGFYIRNTSDQLYRAPSGVTANTFVKASLAYKSDSPYGASSLNGETAVVDTSINLPTAATEMTIGYGNASPSTYRMKQGHIKSLKYYNKRLPNAQLQGLTAQ